MDIHDTNQLKNVRRLRLRELVTTRFGGKQSAFADAIERSPSYVARIFSDNPAHSRNIGESLARQIEEKCHLPKGWLDDPKGLGLALASASKSETIADEAIEAIDVRKWDSTDDHEYPFQKVTIPTLDIPESWGRHSQNFDGETPVKAVVFDLGWLRRSMSMTDISNLRVATGLGESMTPTIKHGDLLVVDVGVTEALYDAVYVVRLGSVLTIKRIQVDMDGVRMLSDNPQFKEVSIPHDMMDRIAVVARVAYIWSGTRT
jgi:phage repressor protein C with HTH and peptisase S24 domain